MELPIWYIKLIFLSLILIYRPLGFASIWKKHLWGTEFSVESPDKETVKFISKYLEGKIQNLTLELDPECSYPSPGCKKNKNSRNTKLYRFSQELKTETLGYFDPLYQKKKINYGGLSQGYLIETIKELKNVSKKAFILNFGKDYYISSKKTFVFLGDPIFQNLPLAKIEIQNGILLSSSARLTGSKITHPKAKKKWKEDFLTIALWANKSFNATRLDAWSTALIPGGHKLLEHLINIDKYKDQWSYVYLDSKTNKLVCSKQLSCKKLNNDAIYQVTLRDKKTESGK